MALNTEIITDVQVASLAVNDVAFDEAYFTNYILTTQRKYIKPVLGEKFFNEILTQIETSTISADNAVLLDSFINSKIKHVKHQF